MNDATQHSNQKETRHAVHPADDLDSTRHELNRCVTAKSSSSNHRRTDVKVHEASTRNEGQKETKAMRNRIVPYYKLSHRVCLFKQADLEAAMDRFKTEAIGM